MNSLNELLTQPNLFGEAEPVPRKGERIDFDFYPTPESITNALLEHVDISGQVYEPFAGTNAISDVLRKSPSIKEVLSNDIVWPHGYDALDPKRWTNIYPDWVVTNPNFSSATEAVTVSWPHVTIGLAMYLRITWIEPTTKNKPRASLLKDMADHMVMLMPVSPRPKHRKDRSGSDSTTGAWFVWRKAHSWKALGIECPFQFCSNWKNEK